MDTAHACGARPLADRARTELLATGARPRRLAVWGADALTASERRVVELAASGLTNRRIAQELFVTGATVETHLRHAFSKLGVRSRVELRGIAQGEQARTSGSTCDASATLAAPPCAPLTANPRSHHTCKATA
jgi:DNA-binding CsgD family transcriptional regulator